MYSIVVGCSGGVYCIMGMLLANLVLNWNEMKQGICNHWIILLILAFIVGYDGIIYVVDPGFAKQKVRHARFHTMPCHTIQCYIQYYTITNR